MRLFEQLNNEFDLYGPIGTNNILGAKYANDYYSNNELIVVKNFGGVLTPKQVSIYYKIIQEFGKWVEQEGLTEYIFIEQPCEIGEDFIAIPNKQHMFFRSTSELEGEEELKHLKDAYQEALKPIKISYSKLSDFAKNQILKGVIKRSVFMSSWETYYSESQNKIIVFEPNILKEDILKWDR